MFCDLYYVIIHLKLINIDILGESIDICVLGVETIDILGEYIDIYAFGVETIDILGKTIDICDFGVETIDTLGEFIDSLGSREFCTFLLTITPRYPFLPSDYNFFDHNVFI